MTGENLETQYEISVAKENKDYDMVRGWIVTKGHEISEYDTQIILYEDGSDKENIYILGFCNIIFNGCYSHRK